MAVITLILAQDIKLREKVGIKTPEDYTGHIAFHGEGRNPVQ